MNIMLQEPWTVERFLAWEDRQEGRHEFDGTSIIPKLGESFRHQHIIRNLLILLDKRLDCRDLDFTHGMRVRIGGKIRTPDVVVYAGDLPESTTMLSDAVAIFEVLSEDTVTTDRTEKPLDYARLPSIRRYVLIEQTMMKATLLERRDDLWLETIATAGSIALPEIGVDLPLDDIYRDVAFDPPADAAGNPPAPA